MYNEKTQKYECNSCGKETDSVDKTAGNCMACNDAQKELEVKKSTIKCKNCGHEFDDSKEPEVAMGAVKCPACKAIVDQEGNVAKGQKVSLDSMRDVAGSLSRQVKKDDTHFNSPSSDYFIHPPVKVRMPDENTHPSPPQISGVRNQRTNAIPGTKAGSDQISGGGEAGSKSAVA